MRRTVLVSGAVSFVMAFLGGILAFSLVVPGMVEAQQARIQAEALGVVGANGVEQVSLHAKPGGGTLELLDPNGALRVQAAVGGAPPGAPPNPDAAGLTVYQPDGQNTVARLGTLPRARPGARGVAAYDGQDQLRAALTSTPDGDPALELRDANGTDRLRLDTGPGVAAGAHVLDTSGQIRVSIDTGGARVTGGNSPEAAGMNVFASDGTTIGRLGTVNQPDGGSAGMRMWLADSQGNQRARINVAADGTPSIELLDAAGNVTWSAQ